MRYVQSLAVVSERRPKSIRRMSAVREAASDLVTVRPPFDPQEFARQSERVTLPPPAEDAVGRAGARERHDGGLLAGRADHRRRTLAVAAKTSNGSSCRPLCRKLLEHVDGAATVEVICARSGVAMTDATDLFEELVREGIVATR